MNTKSKLKYYVILHIIILTYSLGGIASKLAGRQDFFSFEFLFLYGIVLANLAFYAIAWQQILKQIPLTTAFANKSLTIVWGMLIGRIVFQEAITLNNIIGAIIVVIGILLVVTDDK